MGKEVVEFNHAQGITFDVKNEKFWSEVEIEDMVRYWKGLFSTKERFLRDFCRKGHENPQKDLTKLSEAKENNAAIKISNMINKVLDLFDDAKPFTYKEAFEVANDRFRTIIFGSIDVSEMIENLGSKRIKTDGIHVTRKVFDKEGNHVDDVEYDNIYETHAVSSKELVGNRNTFNEPEDIYALKCWCTSTNKEHWIWIEKKYKDDPLSAVASTFRIHENVIPNIKYLMRQGDVMIAVMKEKVKPEGQVVPLTKEQYFDLLVSET